MLLLNVFAAVGVVLASTGTYAVIAYTVSQRRHEFGVRLALGARPGDIVRMVMESGAWVIGIGALFGLMGATAATRLLSSLLFEVGPHDPWTLSGAFVLIVGVALTACWIAARRAAGIDPGAALRGD